MNTYTPTKEELLYMGFHNMNVFLWWKKLDTFCELTYNESQNSWFGSKHQWLPSVKIPFENIGECISFIKYIEKEKDVLHKPGINLLNIYYSINK